MELKVGDQVKFLNDTGGGEITKIISREMVNVLTEDGFEVPVLKEELLKTGEVEEKQDQLIGSGPTHEEEEEYDSFAADVPKSEEMASAEDPGNHVYFAFVPLDQKNPVNGDFETYIINDSDFFLHYLILLKRKDSYVYFSSGDLEDNMKIFIKTIDKENLSELKHFRFQFMFYQKGFFHPIPPLELTINLQPQKFFKSSTFKENDFFDEHAYIVEIKKEEVFARKLSSLTDEQINHVIKEKEGAERKGVSPKNPGKNPEIEEVDLHIEELVDNPKDLSNKEMLDIQMDRFRTSLEGALKNPKIKRMVFIHGVGNGRLRYELRKHLDRYYSNLDYQDASFKEYGYGATLVFIRK